MNNQQPIDPLFVCLTCKTVIGPIWDDEDNQCGCDVYDYKVVRLYPSGERLHQRIAELEEQLKQRDKDLRRVCNEIRAEIERRPQHPNLGKKGCLSRLLDILPDTTKED